MANWWPSVIVRFVLVPYYTVKYFVVIGLAMKMVEIKAMRNNTVDRKHAHVIWLRFSRNLRWLSGVVCGWLVVWDRLLLQVLRIGVSLVFASEDLVMSPSLVTRFQIINLSSFVRFIAFRGP